MNSDYGVNDYYGEVCYLCSNDVTDLKERIDKLIKESASSNAKEAVDYYDNGYNIQHIDTSRWCFEIYREIIFLTSIVWQDDEEEDDDNDAWSTYYLKIMLEEIRRLVAERKQKINEKVLNKEAQEKDMMYALMKKYGVE
jgi:uncharacterized small protein (DUF1192 family)